MVYKKDKPKINVPKINQSNIFKYKYTVPFFKHIACSKQKVAFGQNWSTGQSRLSRRFWTMNEPTVRGTFTYIWVSVG